MSNVNKAILLGRLGKDPEIRYTPSGQGVATFSLATSKKWKDKVSGNDKEATSWHNCKAWGKTGELCHQYLKKGHLVYVEGELEYTTTEKDGVKRYFTAVVVHQVQFLTPKGEMAPVNDPPPEDNSQFGGTDYQKGRVAADKSSEYYTADTIPF
jgi:single-strand DNA-binding protein